MSDEDPTKELPDVPDTEPTMYTVMERLNAMQETMDRMQDTADRRQDTADQRHAEILELFKAAVLRHGETNANFRKLGDKMDILNQRVLETEANQVDLRRRIEELETQAS